MNNRNIQWHPAFAAVLRIELGEELGQVQIEEEHLLGKKPMQIDVLIVKKQSQYKMKKNIARIFREHNVIEYKSPEDYLSVNDYYKVVSYAGFYLSDTEHVEEIRQEEISITMACYSYPKKLVHHLQGRGLQVSKMEDGIYRIVGDLFPAQILVTKELSKEENYWLQMLRSDLQPGEEIQTLVKEYDLHKRQKWYEDAMDTIMRANWKKIEEEESMCEALRELFADELREKEQDGEKQGKQKLAVDLVRDGLITLSEMAKRLGITEKEAEKLVHAEVAQ